MTNSIKMPTKIEYGKRAGFTADPYGPSMNSLAKNIERYLINRYYDGNYVHIRFRLLADKIWHKGSGYRYSDFNNQVINQNFFSNISRYSSIKCKVVWTEDISQPVDSITVKFTLENLYNEQIIVTANYIELVSETDRYIGEKITPNQIPVDHRHTLPAFKEPEKMPGQNMTTQISTKANPEQKPSLLAEAKAIALQGIKLGIGNRVANIIKNHIIKTLKKLKVPNAVLNNDFAQSIILMAGPATLKLVLNMLPNIKVSDKITQLLDAASVASVAQASSDIMYKAEVYIKPLLKELSVIDVIALEETNDNK